MCCGLAPRILDIVLVLKADYAATPIAVIVIVYFREEWGGRSKLMLYCRVDRKVILFEIEMVQWLRSKLGN